MWLGIKYAALSPEFDPTDPAHHQDPRSYTYTKGGRRRNPLTNRPYTREERDAIGAVATKPNFGSTTVSDLDDLRRLRGKYGVDPELDEITQLAELRARERAESEPEPQEEEPAESASASGLPRRVPRNRPLAERDPGWYVSPESQSAGYGVPPMPRRIPGDFLRPSHSPGYAPDQQSIQNWVNWLRSKGIEVDHTLQRPDAARPMPPQSRGYTTGPEIWHQFVDAPSYSGRQLVSSFIKRAISDYAHQAMLDDGWTFHGGHYPGQMGSWYQKTIGNRTHVIVKDDCWIHNSAPAGSEPNEYGELPVDQNPMGFNKLSDAIMYAHTGNMHGNFRSKNNMVPDSTPSPELQGLTGPMIMDSAPSSPRGKFQTLNSSSWEGK